MLQGAQAMFAEGSGADHPYVAEAGVALAMVLRDAGKASDALERAEHALPVYTASCGAEHRATRQTSAFRDDLRAAAGQQALPFRNTSRVGAGSPGLNPSMRTERTTRQDRCC